MKETIAEYIVPVTQDGRNVMFDFLRATELIRCKDCNYYVIAWLKKDGTENKRYKPSTCIFGKYEKPRNPDYYCADAKRRGEE